jgi:hypothetical protein
MSRKGFVEIASRALALNLAIWYVGTLVYVPGILFSLRHYESPQVPTPGQQYIFRYYLFSPISQVAMSAVLFLAAVCVYRCRPDVEVFLSPSEE